MSAAARTGSTGESSSAATRHTDAEVAGEGRVGRRRLGWWLVVAVAVFARGLAITTESAYVHPDAIWQGIEPAYQLLHGAAVHSQLPWEFQEGVRSWAWPAVLAVAMHIGERIQPLLLWCSGAPPGALWWTTAAASGILGLRLGVVALDLLALWGLREAIVRSAEVGGRGGGAPRTGEGSAAGSAPRQRAAFWGCLFFAAHPVFAIPGGQPLIDIPATAALVWCVVAWLRWCRVGAPRDAFAVGFSCGVAVLLRVQLAPAIIAVAVLSLLHRRRWGGAREPSVPAPGSERARGLEGRPLGAWSVWIGGVVVACLLFSGVDRWVAPEPTTPLAWWVGYLEFNLDGGATAFGAMPVDRYVDHARLAFGSLPLFVGALLVAASGRRGLFLVVPALALLIPHQLLSYRVWRFIHPAVVLLVGAAALGGMRMMLAAQGRSRAAGLSFGGVVMAAAVASVFSSWTTGSLWKTTWLFNQGGAAAVEGSAQLNEALLWVAGDLSEERAGSPARQPSADAGSSARQVVQWIVPRQGAPGLAFLGADVPLQSPIAAPPSAPRPSPEGWWIIPEAKSAALSNQGFVVVHRGSSAGIVVMRSAP